MLQTKLKKSVFNIITNLVSIVISIALGFIIPRLILISYGSKTNGLVNSINQFIAYLTLFEAGIATTAMQVLYKPIAENNREEINSIMAALNKNYRNIGFGYFAGLLILSTLYPFIALKSGSPLNYFQVFLCVLFSGLGNVLLFFLQGKYRVLLQVEGKNYILNNLQSIIQILISISKIILINLGIDIVVVIIATFALNLIQVAYLLIYINKNYKWLNLKCKSSQIALSKRGYVFIHEISGLIFQNVDILLLTIICDLKIVSIYAIYKLVMTNLQNLLYVPFNASSFALGQTLNTDIEKFKKTIDCFEVYYESFCFSLLTVALTLFLPFVSVYTRGADINYVDKYLPYLFVFIELLVFAMKPSSNIINYAGHFKETLPYSIIELTINLVLSIVGVIFLGIYGVLIATIVALFYRIISNIIYVNKKVLNRKPWKNFMIYIIDFPLVIFLKYLFSHFGNVNSYIDFIVWGIVYTVCALVVFVLANSLVFKNERKYLFLYLMQRIKHKKSNRTV